MKSFLERMNAFKMVENMIAGKDCDKRLRDNFSFVISRSDSLSGGIIGGCFVLFYSMSSFIPSFLFKFHSIRIIYI